MIGDGGLLQVGYHEALPLPAGDQRLLLLDPARPLQPCPHTQTTYPLVLTS